MAKFPKKHGYCGTQVYRTWLSIRARCHNPNANCFRKYGALGISVCDHWRASFENFLEDMGEPPSAAHSIDRIRNDLGYFKGNCRWATMKEQQNNKTNNHVISAFGRTQTLMQWCQETGFVHKTVLGRLERGWTTERALSVIPVKGRNQSSVF